MLQHWCASRRQVVTGIAIAGFQGCVGSPGSAAATRAPAALVAQMAPGGRLRAAINVGNVVLAKRGGPQGASGVSVDLANEVGRRLGVPVDLVIYDTAGAVVERLGQDRWDIGFMGIDPGRAAEIAFTAPYVIIEGTYMVPTASRIARAADAEAEGVKIAVGRGTAYDLYLTRAIRKATLVRFDTSVAAVAAFERGGLDAVAGIREALVAAQAGRPTYRVLADSFNRIEQAVAIPRARTAAARYAVGLVEELKRDGFVRAALDRHGQTGAKVAPRTLPSSA